MSACHLIDSVILVDHLKGVKQATKWLASLRPGEGVISVITRSEVLAGASDEDEPAVRSLLDSFDCLDITPAVADLAALLCRTGRLCQPGAFQAALALVHGLHLVTRNTKCFSERSHPFVRIPYTLSS